MQSVPLASPDQRDNSKQRKMLFYFLCMHSMKNIVHVTTKLYGVLFYVIMAVYVLRACSFPTFTWLCDSVFCSYVRKSLIFVESLSFVSLLFISSGYGKAFLQILLQVVFKLASRLPILFSRSSYITSTENTKKCIPVDIATKPC